jgi:DNA modification methylase
MTEPFYTDDWLTLYGGDCLDVMRGMPADSVDCVVTSPPYWGLRDYGTATWDGGDAECDHMQKVGGTASSTLGEASGGHAISDEARVRSTTRSFVPYSHSCGKCGATRIDSQLGLERTPEEYVANLVQVFQEVRRVLKPSGTCWLNLGSSYSAAAGASGRSQSRQPERAPAYDTDGTALAGSMLPGFAYSDLCDGCRGDSPSRHADSAGTPAQPSYASSPYATGRDTEHSGSGQASPDASPLDAPASTSSQFSPPLPGSCSHCDRCGACLSVLRSSWPDARACARKSWLNYTTFKPKDLVPIPWMVAMALQQDGWYLRRDVIWSKPNPMPESVTDRPTSSHEYLFLLTKSARYYFDADAVREAHTAIPFGGKDKGYAPSSKDHHLESQSTIREGTGRMGNPEGGRNIRSVWTIATRPYPGAHFAVFPPELPERCIKAGSSEKGVCAQCGAPWERVVERTAMVVKPTPKREAWQASDDHARTQVGGTMIQPPSSTTTGWRPTCHDHTEDECGALLAPAVILDPFGGSGTVGMVANRLSRRAILIDLNPEYLKQQMRRNAQTPLGLTEGDAA